MTTKKEEDALAEALKYGSGIAVPMQGSVAVELSDLYGVSQAVIADAEVSAKSHNTAASAPKKES